MIELSIILPVYNGEDTIQYCIESIKNQTINNFECIIIDDGSIDNTLNIVKKITNNDTRFKIIKKKHEGLSIARNTGINNSSAPIVVYVDADDMLLPNMVEKVITFMNINNLDMMFFNALVINKNASTFQLENEQRYFTRFIDYGISSGKEIFRKMMKYKDFTYAVFIQAIKRECIKYKFYPKMFIEDQLYTIQNLYLANRVGHLNEVLYYKMCRKNSVTYNRHNTCYLYSRTKTLEELLKFIKHENVPKKDMEEIIFPIMEQILSKIPFTLRCLKPEDLECIKYFYLTNNQ